jgi:hypothetical protein
MQLPGLQRLTHTPLQDVLCTIQHGGWQGGLQHLRPGPLRLLAVHSLWLTSGMRAVQGSAAAPLSSFHEEQAAQQEFSRRCCVGEASYRRCEPRWGLCRGVGGAGRAVACLCPCLAVVVPLALGQVPSGPGAMCTLGRANLRGSLTGRRVRVLCERPWGELASTAR